MNPEEEKVQKIIRLKRYEAPPEGYFEDFLTEFQKRRDGATKPQAAPLGVMGKSLGWFRRVASVRLVVAGGLSYAALIIGVLMWPKGPESRPDNREPVIFQPLPDHGNPPVPKKPKDQPEKF
jgi:hypothetical protein